MPQGAQTPEHLAPSSVYFKNIHDMKMFEVITE